MKKSKTLNEEIHEFNPSNAFLTKYSALAESLSIYIKFKLKKIMELIDWNRNPSIKFDDELRIDNTLLLHVISTANAIGQLPAAAHRLHVQKDQRLLGALNDLLSCLKKESTICSHPNEESNIEMQLHSVTSSYRNILDTITADREEEIPTDLTIKCADFSTIAQLLNEQLREKSQKSFTFKPCLEILYTKIAVGSVFAASFLIKIFISIFADISKIPSLSPKSSGIIVSSFSGENLLIVFNIITIWSFRIFLILTAIDIVRLIIMKIMWKRGNLSARFSYALYMSYIPFFTYAFFSFFTRSGKKVYDAHLFQVFECADIGYIPAVYAAARAYETGYFRSVKKDVDKAIELYKLSSGYKDSDARSAALSNRRYK